MLTEADEEEKLVYRRGYYGFLLCLIGPTIFFYFPNFMQFVIQQNVKLKEGTTLTEFWADPPLGLYVYVYLFNATNHRDIPKGIPPNLQEIGPYVFRLELRKEIVRWNTENDTVSYKTSIRFFFEKEMSKLRENDIMYTVNLPVVGMVTLLKESYPIATNPYPSNTTNSLLEKSGEDLIKRMKVKDFLLDGVQVNFLESLVKSLKKFARLDNLLKYKKFSVIRMLNNTPPAYVVAHTGSKGPYAMGEIASLHASWPTSVWDDQYCNQINGTEGENFRHPITHRYQYFYLPQLCRSMKLDYVGNDDVYNIPTKKFIFNSMFASRRYIPHNTCFCRGSSEYCDLNGTVPMGRCIDNLPIVISKPHFYGADFSLHEMVTGLEPIPDEHESYFHLHTMLSMPLLVRICLQFNIRVTRDENIKILRNIADMMLPVAWINLTIDIRDTGYQNMAYGMLVGPPFIAKVIGGLLTGIGAIHLTKALFYPIISKNKQAETSSVKVYPLDLQTDELKEPLTKSEKF